MNSSFLYHALGLYSPKCTREEYKGNTIILHIETKEGQKTSPSQAPQLRNRSNWGACDGGVCENNYLQPFIYFYSRLSEMYNVRRDSKSA